MTPKPQSVCKHCRLRIVRRSFDSRNWYDPEGAVWCRATEYRSTHEPVAEPASPSASPAPRMIGKDALGNGNEHFGIHEGTPFCQQRGCEVEASPAPQPVAGEGPNVVALPEKRRGHVITITVAFAKESEINRAAVEAHVAAICATSPGADVQTRISELAEGTPKLEASELFEEFCQRFNQFSNYIPADDRNTYLIPLLEKVKLSFNRDAPKLEEIAGLIVQKCHEVPYFTLRSVVEAILRPFITPACPPLHFISDASEDEQKQDCCGDRYACNYRYKCSCGKLACRSHMEDHAMKVLATPARTGEANGWVSVADQYPEWKVRVLAFDGKRQLVDYLMDVTNKRWHSGWNMTHWRSLPPAPTSVPQAEPPKAEHVCHLTGYRVGEGYMTDFCPACLTARGEVHPKDCWCKECLPTWAAQAEPKGETK